MPVKKKKKVTKKHVVKHKKAVKPVVKPIPVIVEEHRAIPYSSIFVGIFVLIILLVILLGVVLNSNKQPEPNFKLDEEETDAGNQDSLVALDSEDLVIGADIENTGITFSDDLKGTVTESQDRADCLSYTFSFTKVSLITGSCGRGGQQNEVIEQLTYTTADESYSFQGEVTKINGSENFSLSLIYLKDSNPYAEVLLLNIPQSDLEQAKTDAQKIVTGITSIN